MPNCDEGVVPVVALLVSAYESDVEVATLPAITDAVAVATAVTPGDCSVFASAEPRS